MSDVPCVKFDNSARTSDEHKGGDSKYDSGANYLCDPPMWVAALMVIDTSALVAIFLGAPERKQFLDAILQDVR